MQIKHVHKQFITVVQVAMFFGCFVCLLACVLVSVYYDRFTQAAHLTKEKMIRKEFKIYEGKVNLNLGSVLVVQN